MTDREYAAEKRRICRLLKKWLNIFPLTGWEIHTEIVRGPGGYEDNGNVLAHVVTTWPRMRAVIHIFAEETYDLTEGRLEETIIHELCHVMVAEIAPEEKNDHEERVVTMLTTAFSNLIGGSSFAD